MKKFRDQIKYRLSIMCILTAVLCFFWVINIFDFVQPAGNQATSEIIEITQICLLAIYSIYLVYKITIYGVLLMNDEQLTEYYTKSVDEREMLIFQMSGGYVLNLAILLLFIASIIASYFNPVAFWVLLGSVVLLIALYYIFRFYHRRVS